jgi:hypothetical protein
VDVFSLRAVRILLHDHVGVTNVGYCRVEYDVQLQHSNSNNIYYASFPCTVNWSRYSMSE